MAITTDQKATVHTRRLPFWVWLLVGAAAAVFGLAPWLVTGARLPIQNLWETGIPSEGMPFALLPFSQYWLPFLVSLVVTGSAVAGIIARAAHARRSRFAVVAVLAGVLAVQLTALVQTAVVVRAGLSAQQWSVYYLLALVAATVLAIGIGILVLLLVAKAPVPGATIALAVAAISAGSWLGGLVVPIGAIDTPPMWIFSALRWVPAVLVGLAIAWCGFRSVGRVVGVVVSLLALWIGPAAETAIASAAGTRVLAKYPGEMLEYGLGVFRAAMGMPELVVPPLVVAAAVGIAGSFGLRALAARRRGGDAA
ncbi:hypothetical protein [Microbacterium ulmi]|uniref:Uncharacterized protein n=1 Tax=Microbacterium ulmi TaxID=179095 RepID=A0A7Y2M1Z0_9MICO|nr:hypothetical protein [Microbacterium ulmi]NII68736.1 branched-subunit amino acid transport protein [Microbacterium ulmi]NNH03603.1 hypothetical protein [Microbacterium ulmi]